jgi:hypothetical protein
MITRAARREKTNDEEVDREASQGARPDEPRMVDHELRPRRRRVGKHLCQYDPLEVRGLKPSETARRGVAAEGKGNLPLRPPLVDRAKHRHFLRAGMVAEVSGHHGVVGEGPGVGLGGGEEEVKGRRIELHRIMRSVRARGPA